MSSKKKTHLMHEYEIKDLSDPSMTIGQWMAESRQFWQALCLKITTVLDWVIANPGKDAEDISKQFNTSLAEAVWITDILLKSGKLSIDDKGC